MSPASLPFALTADTVVDDLMSARTETISVFMHHRMMCIGCPVGRIHTIAEACHEHRLDLDSFLAELRECLEAVPEPG
jgi:hybrid cluster-associated redox disulfide protein